MSEFFKSAPVRAAMAEIQELQEDIMTGIAIRGMRDPSSEEGHLYINKMKKQIVESAKFLGLKDGQNINAFFDTLSTTLDKLEKDIPD